MKVSGLEKAPQDVRDYCNHSSAKNLNELLEETINKHPEYLRFFIPILDQSNEISDYLRERVTYEIKNQIGKPNLGTIPTELQVKIFEYLDIIDLRNLSQGQNVNVRNVAEELTLQRLIASEGRIFDLNLAEEDLNNFLDFCGERIETLKFNRSKKEAIILRIIKKCPKLNTLVINSSFIDAAKLAASLGKLTALTSLNLLDNNLGAKGAKKLAASLGKLRALSYLNLSGNRLGAEGAEKLKTNLSFIRIIISY